MHPEPCVVHGNNLQCMFLIGNLITLFFGSAAARKDLVVAFSPTACCLKAFCLTYLLTYFVVIVCFTNQNLALHHLFH